MNLRTRVRRWRIGASRYDLAMATIAREPEAEGRAQAYSLIRRIHAAHPNPDRRCVVPNCCATTTTTPA